MEFYYHDVDGDVLILAADGGINADNSSQFVDDLEKVVRAGVTKLIVDCSKIHYISSSGLGTLIRLHKRMCEGGGDVRLAAVDSTVVRILEITRLNSVFHLYTTVDEARAAFRADGESG